jgi:hypothetical protein
MKRTENGVFLETYDINTIAAAILICRLELEIKRPKTCNVISMLNMVLNCLADMVSDEDLLEDTESGNTTTH